MRESVMRGQKGGEDARRRAGIPAHPRVRKEMKAWMAGTGPAMTNAKRQTVAALNVHVANSELTCIGVAASHHVYNPAVERRDGGDHEPAGERTDRSTAGPFVNRMGKMPR